MPQTIETVIAIMRLWVVGLDDELDVAVVEGCSQTVVVLDAVTTGRDAVRDEGGASVLFSP